MNRAMLFCLLLLAALTSPAAGQTYSGSSSPLFGGATTATATPTAPPTAAPASASTTARPVAEAPAAASPRTPLDSPRSTVQWLIETVNRQQDAGASLDDSGLTAPLTPQRRSQLATRLKQVVDKLGPINLAAIPDGTHDPRPYNLRQLADLRPEVLADAEKLVITRGRDGLWRFTSSTIVAIDGLWNKYNAVTTTVAPPAENAARPAADLPPETAFGVRLRELFPSALQRTDFLLPHYQWISLAVVLALGMFIDRLVRIIVASATEAWFRFIQNEAEHVTRRELGKPIGWLAAALVWQTGVTVIGLPSQIQWIVLGGVKFFAIIAAVVTSFRLIDMLTAYIASRASMTSTRFDDLLVPLVSKSLKGAAVGVGGIMAAEAFGVPITGLLGGLGIGGAALALASKDAVSNMVGSLNLLADRPFEIGDWIITEGVEGTVEAVGFRSTRVRTFYNSLVTLPNSRLTTAVLDNMGRRRYRRLKTTLTLVFDTATERVDAFCEGVRELIRLHPYTRKDFYLVYLEALGDKSLEVQVECFLDCPDLPTELRERHRLLLDVLTVADRLGVHFVGGPARGAGEKSTFPIQGDPVTAGQQVAAEISARDAVDRRSLRIAGVMPQRSAA